MEKAQLLATLVDLEATTRHMTDFFGSLAVLAGRDVSGVARSSSEVSFVLSSTYCLLPTAYLTYYFAGPDLPAFGRCSEASRPEAVVLPGEGEGEIYPTWGQNRISTLLG